jgi:hypothetical protein
MTHYLVQTPLQSESYVYISRLVKTRDPYPGLFQLAIVFPSFSLPPLFHLFLWSLPFIHLYFQLYACLYFVESRVAPPQPLSKSDEHLAKCYICALYCM